MAKLGVEAVLAEIWCVKKLRETKTILRDFNMHVLLSAVVCFASFQLCAPSVNFADIVIKAAGQPSAYTGHALTTAVCSNRAAQMQKADF